MIEFSFEKDITRLHAAWSEWKWAHRTENNTFVQIDRLNGFYGSGKTEFIRQYIHKYKDSGFVSFHGHDGRDELRVFCMQYLHGETAENWLDAMKCFMQRLGDSCFLLFVEGDDESAPYKEFSEALDMVNCLDIIYTVPVVTTEPIPKQRYGNISPRSIADFIQVFPDYSYQDVIRLQGLTGGLPAVAKELDAGLAFEDNLKRLLRFDSAFSRMLPDILNRLFRSPDSYHPIMYSIACGRHRLSEIAKEIGFPNNKCGKYLEALIKVGLVKAEREDPKSFARYYLTNSYLDSWYLYVYKNRYLQIVDDQRLYRFALKTIDRMIAMPALYSACRRYILNQREKDRYNLFVEYTEGKSNSVHMRYKDGFRLKFDFILEYDRRVLLCVYPRSYDERYTKAQMEYYIKAARAYGSLDDDVTLFVFSCNRFSDWCVHQAARYPQLFCVTAERLKY